MWAQIKNWQIIIHHYAVSLRESVALRHLVQVVVPGLARIVGDDDPELLVTVNLVVINLHGFIDLAEGHVYLDK
jgi:hypothetical protein